MSRALLVLSLVCCAALFTGCGSARKARKQRKLEAARLADSVAAATRKIDSISKAGVDAAPGPQTGDTIESAALKPSAVAPVLVWHDRRRAFQSLSAKMKVEVATPGEGGEKKSQTVSASLRIRRDSAIWVSATAAGGIVPVARVLVTPDSVFFVNYLAREAARWPISRIQELLQVGLTYAELQAALVGDALGASAKVQSTGTTTDEGLPYVATQGERPISYAAYYHPKDGLLLRQEARDFTARMRIRVNYDDFVSATAQPFAMKLGIGVTSMEEQYALLDLVLSLTEAPRFDVPLDFSFSIPKNYTLK